MKYKGALLWELNSPFRIDEIEIGDPVDDPGAVLLGGKAIIAVGDMKGEYIEEALTLTTKTGTCVVTGMGSMADVDVKLNLFLFTMLQRR